MQQLRREPCDRRIFFSDGLLERNTTGVDIKSMVASGVAMHPWEAVQDLIQAILLATGGALDDDVTAPIGERTTNSGADQRPERGLDAGTLTIEPARNRLRVHTGLTDIERQDYPGERIQPATARPPTQSPWKAENPDCIAALGGE